MVCFVILNLNIVALADQQTIDLLKKANESLYKKNYSNAFNLLDQAAKLGNMQASYKLGVMFFYGLGTEKNYEKAYKLLYPLAIKGAPDSEYLIGFMTEKGLGVKADNYEAYKWYEKAAQDGHPKAVDKMIKKMKQDDKNAGIVEKKRMDGFLPEDPNDSSDNNLLRVGIANGIPQVVQKAIESGANPNLIERGLPLLHWALNRENYEVVKTLIKNGANPNGKEIISGETAFEKLCHQYALASKFHDKENEQNIINTAKVFIKHGGDVDIALLKSCNLFVENLDLIRLLIDRGANVNIQDNRGNTPFHCILFSSPFHMDRENRLKALELFISKNSNLKLKNKGGETPLGLAKKNQFQKAVVLIKSSLKQSNCPM